MYTHGQLMSMYGKSNCIVLLKLKKKKCNFYVTIFGKPSEKGIHQNKEENYERERHGNKENTKAKGDE